MVWNYKSKGSCHHSTDGLGSALQSCVMNKGNGERLHYNQGCHEHKEGAWSLFKEYAPQTVQLEPINTYSLSLISNQGHRDSDK